MALRTKGGTNFIPGKLFFSDRITKEFRKLITFLMKTLAYNKATEMISSFVQSFPIGSVENRIMMLTDMEIDKSSTTKVKLFEKIKGNSEKYIFTTFIGTKGVFSRNFI